MISLDFEISSSLKRSGIKKIEYINDDEAIATLSIFYKKEHKPWLIPLSPKFDETVRVLDTFIDGRLDSQSKDELKNCINDNLLRIKPHQYKVEQELDYEEWFTELRTKYENLHKTAEENFPGLWASLEFELSVQKILNLKDCSLPFAGILLGPPGVLKTLGLGLFRKWKNVFYTDKFCARAFVSHSTAVKREHLAEIDLLPKIKNKFFLTPELSPTFATKDDDLIETLGIITRILDGQGYESDTGAHGHRGYNGVYMFTWVGAAVDIPYKVHKYLGTLGPKLYFFRLPLSEKLDEEYIEQMNKDDYNVKAPIVQEALIDYLEYFDKCPKLLVDKESESESGLLKMSWDHDRDDKRTERIVVKLGKLLVYLRAVVTTWETDDTQGLNYAYTLATREDPLRAMIQLRNLARGRALSQGRNFLTMEDMPILFKVVFSTASLERVRVFELLISNGGKLTTSMIEASLNTSNNTAKRTMAELIAIGLVTLGEVKSDSGSNEKQITLKDEFDWFLRAEMQSVRNLPPYYSKSESDPETEKERLGGHFSYTCYQCEKDGKNFRTNFKLDYERHWIKSGHPGSCYPGIADLELHGWAAQGKEWEI